MTMGAAGLGSTGPLVKQSEVFEQQLFLFKDKHLAPTTGASKRKLRRSERNCGLFFPATEVRKVGPDL